MVIPDNIGYTYRNKAFGKYALEFETIASLWILIVSLDEDLERESV